MESTSLRAMGQHTHNQTGKPEAREIELKLSGQFTTFKSPNQISTRTDPNLASKLRQDQTLQGIRELLHCISILPLSFLEGIQGSYTAHKRCYVSGGERKVRCCKDLYSLGTWNVRSMNQGKLDVVKQEMTRLNIDILGISELKWTGMGEFNSDDHQGKLVNITIVQVYAPTTGAEEGEVDRFYEGLQHLLELTPKNDVLNIMGNWNAKVGSQKITGITGKLKLKKVGKSTRPLRHDLNHIPDEYTVEVTNRFKKLDLIDRVPEELWTEDRNIVQEVATKTIPKKKKCKKAKWLSEEALQIAEERGEAKVKGERERYTQLNAEFQRIARRDKNAFLNEQCKEIEENNRIGRTRDLFKKIGDMKGTFHAKMGMIKDQNGRDLTEAEEIKKRWQDYTEELYKKEVNIPDNHDGVVTDLEPDILECEVKWALGSLSNNKASGGNSIPAELFKILKDNAAKVLHSIRQQIWKTQQWPQDRKRSVYNPITKKGNAKECSNYRTIALISHASKVCSKSYKLGSSSMCTENYQKYRQDFEEGEELEIKLPTYTGSWRKLGSSRKTSTSASLTMLKPLIVWITTNCGKFLEMRVPDHLICLLRNLYAGQEATVRTGHGTTDWFKIEKGVQQGCILSPCLFNLYAEHIMRKSGLYESTVGIKIAGRNINNLRYARDTSLMAESEEELKSLLMQVQKLA
ncbi:Craniofacial development protein 2 [Varanus komodoensis]|nr:Craniofacial development protein 2 [Varanus komodoensis]